MIWFCWPFSFCIQFFLYVCESMYSTRNIQFICKCTYILDLKKKAKEKKNSFNLSRCLFNWNPFNGNPEEKVLISFWKVIVRDWVSEWKENSIDLKWKKKKNYSTTIKLFIGHTFLDLVTLSKKYQINSQFQILVYI